MSAGSARQARHLALRVPVIALVLAFTAIPTELRQVDAKAIADVFDFGLDIPDIIANVVGYIPVGLVLASLGRRRAIGLAAAISILAEVTQLFTNGRSPSLIDVATNVLGAAIGIAVYARWKDTPTSLRLSTRASAGALAIAACVCVLLGLQITPDHFDAVWARFIAAPPWRVVNDRGATRSGRLEAHWSFDGTGGDSVRDDSGNALDGMLVNHPALVPGVNGRALSFNGARQWVDIGDPIALRLTGSMTLSAWINANAFPVDDAAIVSDHSGLGYQLDTTIDEGPRTIGFKLANSAGRLMARYGRTPLAKNRWYHVAGVYDAEAKTLDVYLNGRLDNGCVMGEITSRQYVSGEKAFVGRRASQRGFEFAGTIDDVRIYSRALTADEIARQVEDTISSSSIRGSLSDHGVRSGDHTSGICPPKKSNDSSDARVVGLVVALGMLVAVGCAGVWPRAGFRPASLAFSLIAGFLLLPFVAPLVPAYFRPLVPLLTFAGALTVAVSIVEDSISTTPTPR